MAKDANTSDLSLLTSASIHSMHGHQGDKEHTPHGATANAAGGRWELTCRIKEEVVPHEVHPDPGLSDWAKAMRPIGHRKAA
ncbi:MAG TPA: hypothetical protein VKV05_06890 [Terriglobales bacterium]|nr:hypothetical protein [Terriglobales bacterium]